MFTGLNREHLTLLTRPEFRSWAEPAGRSAFVWPASLIQGDFFAPRGVHALSRGSGVSIINLLYWRALCLKVTKKKMRKKKFIFFEYLSSVSQFKHVLLWWVQLVQNIQRFGNHSVIFIFGQVLANRHKN